MKIRNDKEIIIGETLPCRYTSVGKEIQIFIKDITQLCYNPCAAPKYRYSVSYQKSIHEFDKTAVITKEQYDYLQEKLGANDDEDE